jgi:26S proteasome regulatory subunit T6
VIDCLRELVVLPRWRRSADTMTSSLIGQADAPGRDGHGDGFKRFYRSKIEELDDDCNPGVGKVTRNLKRLQAQRNELNAKVRELKEELRLLHEPGSYVGEVVKVMSTKKILVKVQPEGKYVVELDKAIDMKDVKPNLRVALRNDSYALHKILPSKIDPLVSLMKVEKVPDSTYDMVGGLDKQVKEIKEVVELPIKHPELFESLGVAQPKVRACEWC